MVQNPFIKDAPVVLKKTISKSFLIERYKKEFNIEVEHILESCEKVNIYECEESGYRFYHPFTITGDSKFYEKLQQYDWYYMPWKWEHGVFRKYVQEHHTILEVGCGEGAFIKKISSEFKSVNCIGLELNESSVFEGKNCKVINAYVQDFAEQNDGVFDLVCSFQVLEHIAMVDSFLEANVKCLKKGGVLGIGVPNNDAFIKYNQHDILNMPPHHMGLWTEKALRAIASRYDMEIVEVVFEPLQEYHFSYYRDLILLKYTGKFLSKVFTKFINLLKLNRSLDKFIGKRANEIKGHSILVIFKKI